MKLLETFKDRKFKYGGYATIIVAVVLAILVVINLFVDVIPLELDLSKERLYSLSEQTLKVLDELEEDVEIFTLAKTGTENPLVDEILKKYARRTDRVTLTNIDPFRNPGFAKKYEDEEGRSPSEGSAIVVSGEKFKAISPYDMYNYRQADPNNPFSQEASSVKIEQVITGAILNVTSAKNPIVYLLQGHKEWPIPFRIREQMENENYTIQDLNLLTLEGVPEDADSLLIISPKIDITADEEVKIREYLFENQGTALFLLDLPFKNFPNLLKLLASYGLTVNPFLVVERDANRHVPELQTALVPELVSHDITDSIRDNDMPMLFPVSMALGQTEVKKRRLEIEPLIVTSEKAYGKIDLQSKELDQTLDDPNGPFDLAVAVTDEGEREGQETRAVVSGSAWFLYPDRILPYAIQPGNIDFFLNSLSWLQGKEELISIRAKSLLVMSLSMNQVQFYIFAGLTMILIPFGILAAGLVIWLRRRHL
jgi:ABC-type uncharacterized transport system involved in gliding motility auxiliary subunit